MSPFGILYQTQIKSEDGRQSSSASFISENIGLGFNLAKPLRSEHLTLPLALMHDGLVGCRAQCLSELVIQAPIGAYQSRQGQKCSHTDMRHAYAQQTVPLCPTIT